MRSIPDRAQRSVSRTFLRVGGFVVAFGLFWNVDARDAMRMPGPAPQARSIDAAAMNAQCESCHADIAAEWQRSFHRTAHTDPVYQRAFAIEPLAFCQGCHAPEANPNAPVPAAVGALGVGCVTCHWTGHEVLAAPRPGAPNDHVDAHPGLALWGFGSPSAPFAPSPIIRDARFAGAPACASCHEFAFPDAGKRTTPELMQSTVTEHASSANADRSCADCHMPIIAEKPGAKPHRSHVFDASRNAAMVRRAVTISATRLGPTAVRVTLEPTWAGHAFPTGDLFRRVEVHVDAVGAEYQSVASATRYLMRHFTEKRHGAGIVRSVQSDDRPVMAPVVVDFDLGKNAAALPIAYRIAYQRVEHPRSERPEDSVVEGEIVLSEGMLPPPGKKP